MLSDRPVIAFLATADIDRARAFLSDIVGLREVENTPFAAVFDAGGTMLRLTPVEGWAPLPHTVLGWRVDDIAAEVAALRGRGVSFNRYEGLDQDDAGIWTAPGGDRVVWFRDADGNVLSLTEFSR
jgi:catechol 2,3-dioxygenase-like lactoylglutathione lyase family enzyme